MRALERILDVRGTPQRITVDNGPEFISSRALDAWAYQRGIILDFIQPGKPMQNGFIESFNGKFRDECMDPLRRATGSQDALQGQYDPLRRERGRPPRSSHPIRHQLEEADLLEYSQPWGSTLSGLSFARHFIPAPTVERLGMGMSSSLAPRY